MTSVILPTYNRSKISFVRGSGSWLESTEGKRYLDFGSGIAVNCLGHSHPKLINALNKQSKKLWHTSNIFNIPMQEELAQLLVNKTFADNVFFTNSGTESIECAIKMARKHYFDMGHPKKNRIITFEGAFHGRSMAAVSAVVPMMKSNSSSRLTDGFAPLLGGFDRVPLGDYQKVEEAVSDNTCAIMIEPIQGEGGINVVPREFLFFLRTLCNQNDMQLIFDEIQCGIGRSGKFFVHQVYGVKPDIVAVAKGLGGGFPIGCCLATNSASSGMTSGTHGSTYGGNPLGCAVGLAVLKEIFSKGFLSDVRRKSSWLESALQKLLTKHKNIFEDIRGLGLMLGIKCKIDNAKVIEKALEKYLILIPASDNTS